MKKKTFVDNEIMKSITDSFLDDAIATYYEMKEKINTEDCFDEYFNSFNDLLKIIEYRKMIMPVAIEFLDGKTNYLYQKGRLPDDYDVRQDKKTRATPVLAAIRPKGSKDNYQKYLVLLSSIEKTKYAEGYNYLMATNFKEVYDKYLKNNDELCGIIVNMNSDNFILDIGLCEYIYGGCDEKAWKKIKSQTKEVLNMLEK